jgi:hypothetical protein
MSHRRMSHRSLWFWLYLLACAFVGMLIADLVLWLCGQGFWA